MKKVGPETALEIATIQYQDYLALRQNMGFGESRTPRDVWIRKRAELILANGATTVELSKVKGAR